MPDYRQWLREYEGLKPSTPARTPPRNLPSRANWNERGTARLPDIEWATPTPRAAQGISQEPNSPWGVAIQDPLERQFVTMTPAGIPVLKPWLNRWSYQPQIASAATAPAAARYYGGGGGGGYSGGWAGMPTSPVPNWWSPQLMNWRYGVNY